MRLFCGSAWLFVGWLLWRARKREYRSVGVGWVERWVLVPFYRAGEMCSEVWERWKIRHGRADAGKKERLCSELVLQKAGKDTLRAHEAKRWGTMLLVCGISCMAGFVLSFQEPQGIVRTSLERGDVGDGSRKYQLQVKGLSDEMVSLQLQVEDRVLEDTEELFAAALREAVDKLCAEGDTPESVRQDLRFTGEVCEGLVEVAWEPQEPGYIRYDGVIVVDQIPEEGIETTIKATFSYENYEESAIITLTLLPAVYSTEELRLQQLEALLQEAEADSREEAWFELPDEFQGQELVFVEEAERVAPAQVVFLGILIGVALYLLADQKLLEQGRMRTEQMQMDYPEIVLKLTVLIRAGLTVRGAWDRIVEGYVAFRKEGRKPVRYAYEEMQQASLRMQGGLAEAEAYLEFGRRTHLHSYLKLSSLLEQNLKKGSRGLVHLLETESEEAWNQRKNLAKQRGEEAGTRMLVPMFLMLILVMLIIVMPAVMSF